MVNKNIIVTLFVTAAAAVPQTGAAQKAAYNTPGAGNPILPVTFYLLMILNSILTKWLNTNLMYYNFI